jgi:hypothetical protein
MLGRWTVLSKLCVRDIFYSQEWINHFFNGLVGVKYTIFCISLTHKDWRTTSYGGFYTVYETTHLIAIHNTVVIYIYGTYTAESIEYFLWSYDLAPPLTSSPPTPVSCLSFSVFMYVELAEERGEGEGRSQIKRLQESLVLCKSFNTLWYVQYCA